MATTNYGFTVPTADDQVDGPAQLLALADSIGPYTMMRFDSAAARDALVTAPLEGMMAWCRDVSCAYFYDGATWRAWPGTASQAINYEDTNVTGITTTETLTDSVSCVLIQGRTYKVTHQCMHYSTVANDAQVGKIREDAGTAGTILGQARTILPIGSNAFMYYLEVFYVAVATASKTFSATSVRSTGTGTITRYAAATNQSIMTVSLWS
jgi:hypothetical protein